MTQLKVKTIILNEDNNNLIYEYLPKHYLEVKEIRDLPKQQDKFVKEVYYTVYSNISYKSLVKKLIRQKYSEEDEYKLHREALINGINEEFLDYNTYVEQCKVQAKEWIENRNKVLEG